MLANLHFIGKKKTHAQIELLKAESAKARIRLSPWTEILKWGATLEDTKVFDEIRKRNYNVNNSLLNMIILYN